MTRFLSALALAVALPAAAGQQVAIVAYHQIEPVPQFGWSVSTEDFIDQMRLLQSAGFHVVSISDAFDYLSGKRDSLPANPVVLTFDDGFVDTFTIARPILKQFGFPASVYVYPNYIDGRGSAAMTWPQVVELSREGFDIESHTMSHPHLQRKAHLTMSDAQYSVWLRDELMRSKAILEQKTGKPVRFLAYPYGDWDAGVIPEAIHAGYLGGLTSWAGLNTRRTSPFELRRVAAESSTTLADFIKAVGAEPLDVRDTEPANETVSTTTMLSATVVHPDNLIPSTVHIAVLAQTATGTYDAKTGRVTIGVPKLTRGHETVIVYGERANDAHPMVTAWTFFTSATAKANHDAVQRRLRALPLHASPYHS